MAKKITLESLAGQMAKGFASADAKFTALADDIADIKQTMATKDQIVALHSQVNAIEIDIRTMNGQKFVTRVADLEEKVFGESRG